MDIDFLDKNKPSSPAFIQLPHDQAGLNNWLFDTIQPFIKGRVLEMDSGVGDISAFFVEKGIPVHLNSSEKNDRDKLRDRFNENNAIKAIHGIDFMDPHFTKHYASRLDAFNTLIALNPSDHGFYNKTELANAQQLLRQKGHLIAVEPAYTALYQCMEQGFEDWKKYNRKSLKSFFGNTFEILMTRYFNLTRRMEDPSPQPFGLSVLVVARKKESALEMK